MKEREADAKIPRVKPIIDYKQLKRTIIGGVCLGSLAAMVIWTLFIAILYLLIWALKNVDLSSPIR